MSSAAAMSASTERQAVAIIARSITGWWCRGFDLDDYSEDDAMCALISEGLMPSRLSADLDDLVVLAIRRFEREQNRVLPS